MNTYDPASLLDRWRQYASNLKDCPDEILLRAAELAKRHDLDLFSGNEIRIYQPPGSNQWVIVVALDVLRKSSQSQSLYSLVPRELTADEVKALRKDLYDPEDEGWEVSLYRLDVARQCKEIGVPYAPTVKVGLWRKRAVEIVDITRATKSWLPDEVPTGRQRSDVAKRRAERAALMEAYPLTSSQSIPTSSLLKWLSSTLAREDMSSAMPHEKALVRDEDDMLYHS